MKVAFFAAHTAESRSGHGVYQQSLLEGLLSQERHSVVVVAHEDDPLPAISAPHSAERFKSLPGIRRHTANKIAVRVRAAAAVRRVRPDVLLANGNWTIPTPPGVPRVVIVYEGVLGETPWGVYSATFTREYTRQTLGALRGARAVVALSETTASAVRRVTGAGEVVVAPPALPAFTEFDAVNPISAPYVASVGWFHPRKDLPLALDAWRTAAEDGLDRDLVLVGVFGPHDPANGSVGRRILDGVGHELARRVHCLGSVPRPTLATVLAGADALMVTSWHEGFGIPVIESFALGTPVIAVARGSLPEACGDVGSVVPPTAESVAAGLRAAVTNPPPAERLRRYAAGFSRDAQLAPVLALLDRLAMERRG